MLLDELQGMPNRVQECSIRHSAIPPTRSINPFQSVTIKSLNLLTISAGHAEPNPFTEASGQIKLPTTAPSSGAAPTSAGFLRQLAATGIFARDPLTRACKIVLVDWVLTSVVVLVEGAAVDRVH